MSKQYKYNIFLYNSLPSANFFPSAHDTLSVSFFLSLLWFCFLPCTLGQSKDIKKGLPMAYSFSGMTAKQGKKNDLKGKKKQKFVKGRKASQSFHTKPALNNYSGGKDSKFQKHGNDKKHSPKSKNRTKKILKNNSKQNTRNSKRGKPR